MERKPPQFPYPLHPLYNHIFMLLYLRFAFNLRFDLQESSHTHIDLQQQQKQSRKSNHYVEIQIKK